VGIAFGKRRVIGNRGGNLGTEAVVVLHHHNTGIDTLYGLPELEIVAIDIDRENANLTLEAIFRKECVYILSGHKRRGNS